MIVPILMCEIITINYSIYLFDKYWRSFNMLKSSTLILPISGCSVRHQTQKFWSLVLLYLYFSGLVWRRSSRRLDPQLTHKQDLGDQRLPNPSSVLGMYAVLTSLCEAIAKERFESNVLRLSGWYIWLNAVTVSI